MDKRIKRALITVAPALCAACSPAIKDASERPNIIFFLIDDFGWTDSQVAYGEEVYPYNQRYDTPNMLRLAGK